MKTREIVAALKRRMSNLEARGQTGVDAALRRMDPVNPGASAIAAFRVMADAGLDLDQLRPAERSAWILVVHSMALGRWRHDPSKKVGEALVAMRFSENRLKQLLSADFETLQQLLPRLARRVASAKDVPGVDFTPLAELALAASAWPNNLDKRRLDIALSYTRFQKQTNTLQEEAS